MAGEHQESSQGWVPRYLTREYPGEQKMSCITVLLGRRNVAKNEYVETGMARNTRVDGSKGEKDGPG
jgi:hypothetical protein